MQTKFINEIITVMNNIYQKQKEEPIHYPTLVDFSWRVDVIISTASLSRVLRPVIHLRMVLSDGSVKQFEMSMQNFQNLRFQTAKVISEMQTLEKSAIFKILDV
eukprot:Anaeramoba_ignava/a354997_16.p1 GENE.a354997_16~~a354997_16.p1  ORF type:complete len:112 (+),score=38.60 a354997_16:26-337(+)